MRYYLKLVKCPFPLLPLRFPVLNSIRNSQKNLTETFTVLIALDFPYFTDCWGWMPGVLQSLMYTGSLSSVHRLTAALQKKPSAWVLFSCPCSPFIGARSSWHGIGAGALACPLKRVLSPAPHGLGTPGMEKLLCYLL